MKIGCGNYAGIRLNIAVDIFRNDRRKNRVVLVGIAERKIGAYRLRRPFEQLRRIVGRSVANVLPARTTFSTFRFHLFLVTLIIPCSLGTTGRTALFRLAVGRIGFFELCLSLRLLHLLNPAGLDQIGEEQTKFTLLLTFP